MSRQDLDGIAAYESLAIVGEGGMLHDEPPTAVAALDRHELLLNALEQFKIQKGSQRCETISFAEYGTFFRINYRVSHAHTSAGLQIHIRIAEIMCCGKDMRKHAIKCNSNLCVHR